MGGEGSGRKPDPIKAMISQKEQNLKAIANMSGDSIYIPNYSGINSFAVKNTLKADPILTMDYTNSRIGILSNPANQVATAGTMSFGSTSTGISFYNTADQVTNYERVAISWLGGIFGISHRVGGTGTARQIAITTNASGFYINPTSTTYGMYYIFAGQPSAGNKYSFNFNGHLNTQSGTDFAVMRLVQSIVMTGTSSWKGFLMENTETSFGSGEASYFDVRVSGANTRQFSVIRKNVDGIDGPVMYLNDVTTGPTANPTTGGYIFVSGTNLYFRSSGVGLRLLTP